MELLFHYLYLMKAAKGKVNITLLKSKGSEALGYPDFISYS
jgi:hypothetical protein